jgi:hypothetical protein
MDNLCMGIVGVCHRVSPARLVIHRHHPTRQAYGCEGRATPVRTDLCVQWSA